MRRSARNQQLQQRESSSRRRDHEFSEYSATDLEASIDQLRMSMDWTSVSALIKRYAHVFDIGASDEENQGERSRAYYWVVMAEIMLHQNKDLQNAGFCITRAAERDPGFSLWRVILVKILMTRTKKLSSYESSFKSVSGESEEISQKRSSSKEIDAKSGGVQMESYDKAIGQLDINEQRIILSLMDSFKLSHRKAIMSSFSALSSEEILRIFMEILVRINQLNLDPVDNNTRVQFVYTICKKVLQVIHISDYYQKYIDGGISDYNFLLVLDGISFRSLLREVSGETQQARSDLQEIIHIAVKPYTHSLYKLPEPIRHQLLFACCRLPILEREMKLFTSSLKSFKYCVSGNSIIAPHLTESAKVALSMTASEMMIQLAYSMRHNVPLRTVSDSNEGDCKESGDRAEESSIEQILNHAYLLLVQVKEMLMAAMDGSLASIDRDDHSDRDFLSLHTSSLIFLLRSRLGDNYSIACKSDPSTLFRSSLTGNLAVDHVSILLASIIMYLKGKKTITISSFETLTWAISASARPSYDLLWNVSQMYLSPHIYKPNEAVSLMQQCIERKDKTIDAEETRTIFQRSELSSWLGLGVQIHKYTDLPALKCSVTCLLDLGDPNRAINIAMKGLIKCAGAGGVKCVDLVKSKLKSADSHEISADPSSHMAKSIALTVSTAKSLSSAAVNVMQFMLVIGKSYAALSRCTRAGARQRRSHAHKSMEIFDLMDSVDLRDSLDAIPSSSCDDWSYEDAYYNKCRSQVISSFVFEYSALLAELGWTRPAIERLRMFLDEVDEKDPSCNISNHLHLLAVLLDAVGGEDDELLVTNIAAKALHAVQHEEPLATANIKLTLAYIYRSQSQRSKCVALVDQIAHAVTSCNTVAEHIKLYKSAMESPFQIQLMKVRLLLGCSELYRLFNMSDRAQDCLEEAWLIFYSPDLYRKIYHTDETDETDETRNDHDPRDSFSSVNSMRGIPTLRGWRLPTGMGWGIGETVENGWVGRSEDDTVVNLSERVVYVSFEADLYSECAELLLSRSKNDAKTIHRAIDILCLALNADTHHFRSKLLLAKTCIDAIENNIRDDKGRARTNVFHAHQHAKDALRERPESTDAWINMGRCYELMGRHEDSLDAYLKSLEYKDVSFVRPIKELM